MTDLEVVAVVLALIYVVLTIYQQRFCWVVAAASASLYIIIFWQVQLYLEAMLQVFYIVMAAYGWWFWSKEHDGITIHTWPLRQHLIICAALAGATILVGFAMQRWTNAAAPYVDALTTLAALLTTWMVAQKLLENWLYWVVIDVISVGLYLHRDLTLTAGLFGIYVVLAVLGYRTWRSQWQAQLNA